jgi:hypothetical protein
MAQVNDKFEQMKRLLIWSFNLSSVEQNSEKLNNMINNIEKTDSNLEKQRNCEVVQQSIDINLHLKYMAMQENLNDVPDFFTKDVMRAYNLGILTENIRIILAKRLPMLAMSIIIDDIQTISNKTLIAAECATLYPEFMLNNMQKMSRPMLLLALRNILKGDGQGRIHTIPDIIEDSAQNILDFLCSKANIIDEEYDLWSECISSLVGIITDNEAASPTSEQMVHDNVIKEISRYACNPNYVKYYKAMKAHYPIMFKNYEWDDKSACPRLINI